MRSLLFKVTNGYGHDQNGCIDIEVPWDGTREQHIKAVGQIDIAGIGFVVDTYRATEEDVALADRLADLGNMPENSIVSLDSRMMRMVARRIQKPLNRFTGQCLKEIVRIFTGQFAGEERYAFGMQNGDIVVLVHTPWTLNDMLTGAEKCQDFWKALNEFSDNDQWSHDSQYHLGVDYKTPSWLSPLIYSQTNPDTRWDHEFFKSENIVFRFWWD